MGDFMAFLLVNGVPVKTPSKYHPVLQDISASDAGRTDDMVMHKNRVGQKWKISLAWNGTTPEETASILQAFDPEYFMVTFINPKTNSTETREFYSGDRSAPMKQWFVGGKLYEQISFDIIER